MLVAGGGGVPAGGRHRHGDWGRGQAVAVLLLLLLLGRQQVLLLRLLLLSYRRRRSRRRRRRPGEKHLVMRQCIFFAKKDIFTLLEAASC